jgi:hypothetical protein
VLLRPQSRNYVPDAATAVVEAEEFGEIPPP